MRTKPRQIVAFGDRGGHECGAIPGNMVVVVVVKASQREKRGFSRLPAELCLNGECTDANGYYIEQNDPAAFSSLPLPG